MDAHHDDQEQGAESLEVSPALTVALKRLLRPLVRFLLTKGVTYPFLSDLLKTLYVDVAAHDLPLQGKRQTDSRLTLLTGVHRKDVRRLMSLPAETLAVPTHVSFGARLVARWCGDPAYLDESGHPLPLPRLASKDCFLSFERLVMEESKDIRARAVLDELLRLGVVSLDGEDVVSLRVTAFVPEKGVEEKIYYLGRNLRDHMACATGNVLGGQAPFLERSVYSDGLSEAGIAELAALSETLSMEALRAINRRARELREGSPGASGGQRMAFGVYFFNEPSEQKPSEQEASP